MLEHAYAFFQKETLYILRLSNTKASWKRSFRAKNNQFLCGSMRNLWKNGLLAGVRIPLRRVGGGAPRWDRRKREFREESKDC